MMNTPIAYSRIIGQSDGLPNDQMSTPLEECVKIWDNYIQERKFPIREQTEVVSVKQDEGGSLIVTVKSDDQGPKVYRRNARH